MVAREAEAGLGGLDEEAAGAGHVVVDGDKADPDWTDGDGFAVRYARSCWMPPGKVAGAVGRRPDRLHGGGVVEREARAEEGNQAGVVQVHVRDEEVGAAVPGVAGVDALERGRGTGRQQVGQLAAVPWLQAQGKQRPAGGVLAPEVEEAARVAVLDQKLEPGRVAGVEEGEQRACGTHGEPTI